MPGSFLFSGYAGLFVASFVAATIFPAQSELVLSGMLVWGNYDTGLLLAVATIGNVLGSTLNWVIGRVLVSYRDARWFPVSPRTLAKAEAFYGRFGLWSLFLSWVPIIGDPLTLAAGVLRAPFVPFVVLVTIAKGGRYLVLAAIVLGWMGKAG